MIELSVASHKGLSGCHGHPLPGPQIRTRAKGDPKPSTRRPPLLPILLSTFPSFSHSGTIHIAHKPPFQRVLSGFQDIYKAVKTAPLSHSKSVIPQKTPYPLAVALPYPRPQPPATTNLLSVSMNWPIPNISCK